MKGYITLETKTYSMGVLWNLDAWNLNFDVAAGFTESLPVDGDALARTAATQRAAGLAWGAVLGALMLDAAPDVAGHDRSEYRAHMSAHVANVLAGGDMTLLEPTC